MITTKTASNHRSLQGFDLQRYIAVLEGEASTNDKREAMSAIGRRRDPALIDLLKQYSDHPNPELALQAIRGLFVFKHDPAVRSFLQKLAEHPNDMVRDVVVSELFRDGRTRETDHALSPDFMKNAIVHGDVRQTLALMPDRSIHLTFTSPPYFNAREYAKYRSYEEYLDFLGAVFAQVHRVTKEGRFFVLNTSPVIAPRAGRKYASRRYPVPFDIHPRLMQMGWEFIDDIIWAKPEKSAKNRVAGFEMHRKPLTYKANARTEMLMVYRKKSYDLIDWNLRQYPSEIIAKSKVTGDFERSNVWNIAPATDPVHSAVFPVRLCDQVIKLYSFWGDLVFDPFAGSGTVGRVASANGRDFFLSEMKADYVMQMQSRLATFFYRSTKPMRVLNVEEFGKEAQAAK